MQQTTLSLFQVIISFISVCVALLIYFLRRYILRKNVATALISEVEGHRSNINGIQPHLDEKQFKESKAVKGMAFQRYVPGYVPSPSRMITHSYESNTEIIASFNQETIELLSSYYTDIYFVSDLLQDTHDGKWLPPAAYNLLEGRMRMLQYDSDELIEFLEKEKQRFRAKKTIKKRCSEIIQRLKYFIAIVPSV